MAFSLPKVTWFNVYRNSGGYLHGSPCTSRAAADMCAAHGRLYCVKVTRK